MRYDDLNALLVQHLPELEDELDRSYGGEAPDGPHVTYGELVVLKLEQLLTRPRTDSEEAFVHRAFALLEHLAADEDPAVQNIVAIELGESLASDDALHRAARPYMGAATHAAVALATRSRARNGNGPA